MTFPLCRNTYRDPRTPQEWGDAVSLAAVCAQAPDARVQDFAHDVLGRGLQLGFLPQPTTHEEFSESEVEYFCEFADEDFLDACGL